MSFNYFFLDKIVTFVITVSIMLILSVHEFIGCILKEGIFLNTLKVAKVTAISYLIKKTGVHPSSYVLYL